MPDLVGRVVWPPLLLLRRFGRPGLFLSWILYLAALVSLFLLAVRGLEAIGARVVRHSYDTQLIAAVLLGVAIISTIRGENPTRDFDQWIGEAFELLRSLAEKDLAHLREAGASSSDLDDIRHHRPTVAYLEHLRRLTRQIPQAAPARGYAWDLALERLADEIGNIQDALGASIKQHN